MGKTGECDASLGEFLAPPPTGITALGNSVELLEWRPSGAPQRAVLVVPGWGAHPRYYGHLIAALGGLETAVISPFAPSGAVGTREHFCALSRIIDDLRLTGTGGISVVAESLGATYLLAAGSLRSSDRAALLAPGLILRLRQVISRQTVRHDIPELIRHQRVDIAGMRLNAISDNDAFLAEIRSSGLTPNYSSAGYVWGAVCAATSAVVAPRGAGTNWILHGLDDRLVSPIGSRLLARRLGSTARLTMLPGVEHGVLWDRRVGAKIAEEIAAFAVDRNEEQAIVL